MMMASGLPRILSYLTASGGNSRMPDKDPNNYRPTVLERLEAKVDSLTNAVNRLVIFEERQAIQALAIESLRRDVLTNYNNNLATDKKVDMWVNRGVGLWVAVSAACAAAFTYLKSL